MIAIRFVSLHSLFDSILGDIQHERGRDRKEIKYFKRRIAAVNSISLEMAIWKIDQFHPLALLSACTESVRAVRWGKTVVYFKINISLRKLCAHKTTCWRYL